MEIINNRLSCNRLICTTEAQSGERQHRGKSSFLRGQKAELPRNAKIIKVYALLAFSLRTFFFALAKKKSLLSAASLFSVSLW